MSWLRRASRWSFVALLGLLVQDYFDGLSLGRWWSLVTGAALVAGLMALLTWKPVTDRITTRLRRPPLLGVGIEELWRPAFASRDGADLQVLYLRVRNDEHRRGSAPLTDPTISVEAWSDDTRLIQCQGNWLSLSAGRPYPEPTKTITIHPGHEAGIELMAKFRWQDEAYLAGQADPPALPASESPIRIRVTIRDTTNLPTVFEQRIYNPGAERELFVTEMSLSPL